MGGGAKKWEIQANVESKELAKIESSTFNTSCNDYLQWKRNGPYNLVNSTLPPQTLSQSKIAPWTGAKLDRLD